MVRSPIVRRAALLGLLLLSACIETRSLNRPDLLPALPPGQGYRASIVTWAKSYFRDPGALRAARISAPVSIEDSKQTPMWLVCVEADVRASDGSYIGPQRFAFGFTGATMASAPQRRGATTLASADCERFPLAYGPFPELERIKGVTPRP